MKLVVGLGNPGNRYNFTRHNVGFLAVDFYAKKHGLEWKNELGALACRDGDTWFIKPQEYYNMSGRAVKDFVQYYKIATSDILVICDNFDLAFGALRYRQKGSAGGNNGLKSVDAMLGTADYPRLRIGTLNSEKKVQLGATDFVLSRFTDDEKAKLPEILDAVLLEIEKFVK